ncbi:MAG: beta galactosidase jelly roll domain-containing protein [Bacteroidota bacterium]
MRRLLVFVLLGVAFWGLYVLIEPALGAWGGWALPGTDRPTWTEAAGPPDLRDWDVLVDLRGRWDFRIGDDASGTGVTPPEARFDGGDARPAPPADVPGGPEVAWDDIFVPAAWEDEGYFGYDGFAWYRTAFALDDDARKRAEDQPAFLLLGRIDDTDEVWLNGTYLGRGGRMPPLYKTASYAFRTYRVPPDLLRLDGPNTLAIRVYDEGLEGGILEGPVALVVPTAQNPLGAPLVADLAGTWRFHLGDDLGWAEPDADVSRWDSLRVPAMWDAQGYNDYDGFAWYRTTVALGPEAARQDLVLVLGTIDDLDQTFVNGVEVGRTGDLDGMEVEGTEWLVERAYPVPEGLLRAGDNTVAVRVFDVMFDGGIYRGPVGLMTPEAYARRGRRTAGDM